MTDEANFESSRPGQCVECDAPATGDLCIACLGDRFFGPGTSQ